MMLAHRPDLQQPMLRYQRALLLRHNGDCHLLGISADWMLHVEEIYGDEDWLAQHALLLNGQIAASADECAGTNPDMKPLTLPEAIHVPETIHRSCVLNTGAARYRGMRHAERIQEWVQPLSPPNKTALAQRLELDFPPALLLGIVESVVLAEANLPGYNAAVICRRLRLAYALLQPRCDEHQQPYDYDTITWHSACVWRPEDDPNDLSAALKGLPGVELRRPMDTMICDNHLYVADGGEGDRLSAVQVWQIT